jgi:hypothetical protein
MEPVSHLRLSPAGLKIFNPAPAIIIAEDILITLGEQASIRNLEGIAGGRDV